jgi:predicted RNase H-like HicB family nuclease
MKGSFSFTAQIEKDSETGLFVGYIPELPGAHSQAESLDELHRNLVEVASLLLEELTEEEYLALKTEFIGTQKVLITV